MATNNSRKHKILVRPIIDFDEVKKIVFDLYGLKVIKILALNGYDDKNFHILVNQEVNNNKFVDKIIDCGYVLKVVNSLDSQDESRFEAQTELLIHLKKNNISCPKTVLTKEQKPFKKIQLTSGEHIVRLLDYIPGDILYQTQGRSRLFYNVGVLAAKIDNVLQTFDHPSYHKSIQWCLGSAPDILNYLHAVKDEKRQHLVRKIIEEFASKVLSIEDELDKGLIHGDINEQNLIVEHVNNPRDIKAVIDFGDVHYACYLYELAIAMTYMIFMSNLVDSGGYVLAGYSSVRRVSEREIALLRICILTRFCQSLVLGAYVNLQEPDNEYVLTTGKKGWELIETVNKIPEDVLSHRWKTFIKS